MSPSFLKGISGVNGGTQDLLQFFQKAEREEILCNSFYKASKNSITKENWKRSDKKKKLQANTLLEHRCKKINKY